MLLAYEYALLLCQTIRKNALKNPNNQHSFLISQSFFFIIASLSSVRYSMIASHGWMSQMLMDEHTTVGLITATTVAAIGSAADIMRTCYSHQMTTSVSDDTAVSQILKTTK